MPTLLVCRPSHYNLCYEINAWMNLGNKPDLVLAARQWEALYCELSRLVNIKFIESPRTTPDLVFTANAGLVLDDHRVILSRFRYPERQPEESVFGQWFKSQGYTVLEMPKDCFFEGEGDCLPAGNVWLAGYLRRSDIQSHRIVSELSGKEVLSLELIHPRWYHLDTALFVLDAETVVYYPGAFDPYAQRVLEQRFRTLRLTEEEAFRFAGNSIVLGRVILMPDGCPVISGKLAEAGYEVRSIGMSEYLKSGGACKCLTLFLERSGW